MAKDNAELYAMPQPQSRNEKYLNYLAGRAVDLNLLPDPQSRIEEYLEYLCYNRGAGGGGGQPFVGLTNATINNNIITFYRSDGTSFPLNLKDLNLDKLINAVNLADTKIIFTKVDGTTFEVDLDTLLVSDKIKYNNANSGLVATNVQAAIDELSTKVKNSYVDSEYNPATGILTLIKENGTRDERNFSTGLIKNVSYDVQTQMLNIETVDGQTLTADLTDLASKTLDNIFTGKNTFKDINLGLPIQVNANQSIQNGGWSDANLEVKTGHRELTSHSQNSNGYVRNIVIRVGNVTVGEKVNVSVWEVKKGIDRNSDTPTQLYSNLELTTVEHTGYFGGGVAVKIPINKKYSDETYFIYQVVGKARIFRVTGATANDDYIFLMPTVDVTQNNIATSPRDSVGAHILELGDVSVGDLLSGISSESVTSVNNIKPVDGNVTVKAEHIEYNNQASQLIAADVKGAIDELNGKFVSNVTYDETQNRTIFKTKGGQEETVVEGLVTRWKHLENAIETTIFNLFNPTSFIDGEYWTLNGLYFKDDRWGSFKIPCQADDRFTVFKKGHDSKNYALLDGDVWIDNLASQNRNDNGWQRYEITIPNDPRINTISIPIFKTTNDYKTDVMIFEGHIQAPPEYIPFTNNRKINIDGEKVNISFDASTTELSTNNVVDAIKELDMRVINTGAGMITSVNNVQPINGNVQIEINNIDNLETTLEGKVPKTDLVSIPTPDKVPQLNNQGKLDIAFLPDLSFNQVHSVADKTEAINLINANTARVGDIFIVRNNNNSVHMYVNQAGADFDTKCVELTMANGTVRTVNGKTPDAQGNVRINADNITLANGNSNVEAELNKKIQSINSVAGINGNIDLSINNTTNSVEFKVDTHTFGTLNYMTDQDANTIINGFNIL